MKLSILGPAAALMLAAAPSAARAQAQPGDVVRVWTGPQRQEGIVVAAAADTLRLAVYRSDTVALAWSDVRRIDVNTGRMSPRESMVRGMVRGLGFGVAIGAVAGFAFGEFCHVESSSIADQGTQQTVERRGCGTTGRVIGTAVGAVGGGAIGMGVGAVYGTWKPRSRWERARTRPELAVGAAPGGVALAVDLRF